LTKKIFIFLAALILFAACVPDEEYPVQSTLKQPKGYAELVAVYRTGVDLLSYKFTTTASVFTFESCEVSVQLSAMPVRDLSKGGSIPRIVLGDNGKWIVGGAATEIPSTKGKDAESSYPVYAYILDGTLHIFISNGQTLDFPLQESQLLVVPDAQVFTMPIVKLTHSSDRVHKSYAVDGTYTITDSDKHYSNVKQISGNMTIQGRGNSTWGMPKQPYKIKLAEKQAVLGMPANRDWILLANYADKSLLRNATAMKTSEIVNMPWTPRYRNVEVYLNNEYLGVYNLFESKEVAKNKVNLDLDAGEMYLEIESSPDDHIQFYTNTCGVPIQFQEPENPTTAQQNTVKNLFNNFERVLYSDDFKNTSSGYAKYIDVDSFIDFYIIEELAKDIDGNIRKSSFMSYKPSTGKLAFYHVWDFDLCYGNANYFPGDQEGANGDNNGPYGWWIRDFGPNSTKNTGWYYRLFQDPNFVKKLKARWKEVYPNLALVPDFIDLYVEEMGNAPVRNFNKWTILSYAVWPNVKVPGTYAGEVSYLKDYYTKRLNWLDTNISKL